MWSSLIFYANCLGNTFSRSQWRIVSYDFCLHGLRRCKGELPECGHIMVPRDGAGTNTGSARWAIGSAPNALRKRQLIGGGTHRKTCGGWMSGLPWRGGFSKGCSMRKQPRLLFSRGNCGFLDLTNNGELVLDCEVGDQYPYGLASIT